MRPDITVPKLERNTIKLSPGVLSAHTTDSHAPSKKIDPGNVGQWDYASHTAHQNEVHALTSSAMFNSHAVHPKSVDTRPAAGSSAPKFFG